MKLFKVVCRGSNLSLAQADIFRKKLMAARPAATVEIIIKETEGDINQSQPLIELEGKDFFTKDVQDYLLSGRADFAVHSLKDVSGEDFFKDNCYAIIEREDPHDVAIFNEDVVDRLKTGDPIRIGTSSPRRVEMASKFLRKALPIFDHGHVQIDSLSIRGNVDSRLRKLDANEYDGIILACAGLNRLLRVDSVKDEVSELLKRKLIMILPLLECPPAPGQGAIVAETYIGNEEAVKILKEVNDPYLAKAITSERKFAYKYGSGCHQKFGVIHIDTGTETFTYASGKDREDHEFSETLPNGFSLSSLHPVSNQVVSDLMNDFNIKLFTSVESIAKRSSKKQRNWVSKTDLWFDLAQQGEWVHGSMEGFGFKFIEATVKSPLVQVNNKLGS